ncbi:DMT family transporter [Gemelliphila asaccharolytica]|uniref:Membrane protein n=1 Tax=Gemelliphila asaccharolytica TaxID=502393 RepID=A0ABR5TMY9_9BACL|nr:DMT family transporter [Gemella asaccharolytica]KXB58715.1 putative membrane protein [Gemella asaccharolytica]
MRKLISQILLLLVTIIWGLGFVWQNVASKSLGPYTTVGIRAIIAVIFLILISLALPSLYKSQNPKHNFKKIKYKNIILPLICGVALFFAMSVQQMGMAYTTASKAGFISVMYICIVPLIGIFLGQKLNKFFLIGLIMSVIGLYLLSIKDDFTLGYGDLLILISAFLFAVHILIISFATIRINSMLLSIGQFLVVGILSLAIGYFYEGINLQDILAVINELLALGVLCSGVAFTLQIIGQREVEAHTASLILSLESLFGAIGGVIILKETLTTKELLGMIILFIGVIVSQKKVKKANKN